jgi:polysaccharide biosynthesis/export protein
MKTKKVFSTIFAVFLAGLFAAQAVSGQTGPKPSPEGAPRLKAPSENRYRLVPGDVVEVVYRYTPEFNQTVTIQPDGYVVLEIVGDIRLGTLTLVEAKGEIVKKASVRLKDPEVTLLLKEFQKPYFVVSGEVPQPGKFEMREAVTALQAVLTAGGFKESAKSSQIVIFRRINLEFAEVKVLNLKNIRRTGDLENDLALESGDMIFVPRNNFSKFEKYVRLTSLASILSPFARL